MPASSSGDVGDRGPLTYRGALRSSVAQELLTKLVAMADVRPSLVSLLDIARQSKRSTSRRSVGLPGDCTTLFISVDPHTLAVTIPVSTTGRLC